MSNYKILCVDDEDQILPIYQMMLEDLGYEIVMMTSCLNAIEYIKENGSKILLIFSDYQMNEMNGIEFKKQINSLGHDIPFAIITGFYDLEMAEKAMEHGISKFVEKPFKEIDLKNLFNTLGEKRWTLLNEENEMIISFIDESYPMLEEIEDILMSLEANPDSSNLLNTYFRLLHTIKGTASCVGLKAIPKFTHKYEDLVVKLQAKQIALTLDIAEVLFKGLDQLKYMYAEVKNGNFEIDIENALGIFDIDNLNQKSEKNISTEVTPSSRKISHDHAEVAEDRIAVSVNVLNNFMELSGKLTVLRNTLKKSAVVLEQRYHGDNDIEIVIDSLDEMHKVSSILQNEISEMRKVSLEVIYKPLRRVIRDSSKSLNKNIEFQIDGEGLRVDTTIGKVLSNSLVHMIRNSIDHGIELPENRIKAGKNATGNILLKSYQDGENIIVILSADGNGLNIGRIKEKAIEKKLYTEEQLMQMSDQRIFALIFDSGFSTAQVVSDISGRGVGMDMVKTSIDGVGGKIIIDSTLGQVTRFTLTLPIPRSVLIIKSLMIKSNEATYSIPLDEVAEVLRLENYRESKILHSIENSLILSHQDDLMPLIDLNQVLYKKMHYDQFDIMNIVIVQGDGFKYGIIVDEIMDIEEIVVKKMSKQLKNAHCFFGVTFIGHGALALILNLSNIAEMMHVKGQNNSENKKLSNAASENNEMEFMQFNLKKSHYYAFPLDLVNRLEEIPTNEIEFFGSIPLTRYRGEVMPMLFIERQLRLCSAEESLIQFYPDLLKVIVVNLHNKKFGIVVDEILDIGKTTAQVNTENIDREEFIGTIFIEDKTVTLMDVFFIIDNFINFEKNLLASGEESLDENIIWNDQEAA